MLLWVACVLCTLGLASRLPLLLTLKCDCEMLMYLLTVGGVKKWLNFHLLPFQNNTYGKMKDKIIPLQWKLQLNLLLTAVLE